MTLLALRYKQLIHFALTFEATSCLLNPQLRINALGNRMARTLLIHGALDVSDPIGGRTKKKV